MHAMIWGIWVRNRNAILAVIGITLATCIFNLALPDSLRSMQGNRFKFGAREGLTMLNMNLGAAVFIFLLAIFNYTEENPGTGSTGFPRRLFTLPVSTFRLVAVPVVLGVVSVELIYLVWVKAVFWEPGNLTWWFAILFPTYMILYQTIQWTFANTGAMRMLVQGLVGIVVMFVPNLNWQRSFSESGLMFAVTSAAVMAFVISWAYVARQRSGGGSHVPSLKPPIELLSYPGSRNGRSFRSPAAAQFWFEWRRFGWVLPLLVTGMLSLAIVPITWLKRSDANSTLWTIPGRLVREHCLPCCCGVAAVGSVTPRFVSSHRHLPSAQHHGSRCVAGDSSGPNRAGFFITRKEQARTMNRLVAVFASVVTLLALLLAAEGQSFQRINAGGTRLRMLIVGNAGPTVVFETGLTGSLDVWGGLPYWVGRFARAVTYDGTRPVGQSDTPARWAPYRG